jgi:uncharacterized RDD family membrane protein YckC
VSRGQGRRYRRGGRRAESSPYDESPYALGEEGRPRRPRAHPPGADHGDRPIAYERVSAHPPTDETRPVGYAGVVTRSIAFMIDSVLISIGAVLTSIGVTVALDVLQAGNTAEKLVLALAAPAAILWICAYFTFFWTTTGQTPGNSLLHIKVADARDLSVLPAHRALLRIVVLMLSLLLLLVSLVMALVGSRRRAIHDLIARSVVVDMG